MPDLTNLPDLSPNQVEDVEKTSARSVFQARRVSQAIEVDMPEELGIVREWHGKPFLVTAVFVHYHHEALMAGRLTKNSRGQGMPRRKGKDQAQELFPAEEVAEGPPSSRNGSPTYEAISSVWERSDGELLEAMFAFYPTVEPEPILDATYNTGRF